MQEVLMNTTSHLLYDLSAEKKILYLLQQKNTPILSDDVDCFLHVTHLHVLLHVIGHNLMSIKLPVHLVRSYIENEINLLLSVLDRLTLSTLQSIIIRVHALYHDTRIKSHPLVTQTINLVHQHLYIPLSVSLLARMQNISTTHLSKTFKAHYGMALSDYILSQKLERATLILQYTKNSTLDISLGLGFSSQSHFCQTFKRHYDCSPTKFRQHLKINV